MSSPTDEFFEFNLWANLEIIAICAALDESQLAVEVQGAYGRIQPTIAHIVRSEGNYLRDMGGEPLWDEQPHWDALSIAEVGELARLSGNALRKAAGTVDPKRPCGFVREGEQFEFPAWLILNQAVNHGIEHRTQLRMLLTKLGVPHPGQSVWGFAKGTGALRTHPVSGERP